MFKEVNNNPPLDDVEHAQAVLASSHVKQGAEDLMDELFHEIEIYLDDPTAVDSLALKPANPSSEDPAWMESFNQQDEDELLVSYTPMDSTLALKHYSEASGRLGLLVDKHKDSKRSDSWGQRTLVSTTCAALVGISMFWVGRQLRLQHTPVAVAVASGEAMPETSADTQAFADYVSRSLERIHREVKAQKLAAASPAKRTNRPAPGMLPDLPNIPNVEVAPSGATSIPENAERVYVPVAEVPVPNVKPKPLSPPQATPTIAAVNDSATAKEANKDANTDLPELQPLPITPPGEGDRKLLGGTVLGDQPMFMVSINGSTRHFKLGETIDETGATFVEFDGEQSVLKQGNQLRTVTAGQSF